MKALFRFHPAFFTLLPLFCLSLFPGTALPVSAENLQDSLPLSSDVYRLIEILEHETGAVLPTSSFPLTRNRLQSLLREIPRETLSRAGKAAYGRIEALLGTDPIYDEGAFTADVDAAANGELYLHSNRDFSGWVYGFDERKPMFTLSLSAWFGKSLYLGSDLDLKKEPLRVTEDPDNVTNILTTFDALDITFPFRAFVSAGGEHWNVRGGRDRLSWGNGSTGNMLVSDYADYHEFLEFSAWGRNFTFTSLFLSLAPWLYPSEETEVAPGVPYEPSKLFIVHRFEFRFFNRAMLALSEGMLLGGKYPELRYLNPLMIYHNFYLESNGGYSLKDWGNAIMSVELTVNPWRYATLYGQAVIDQYQTSYEVDKWNATAIPNGIGYLAGGRAAVPLGGGYLSGRAEWAYTSPWLYIREHSLLSFSTRRLFISNTGNGWRPLLEKPIGYAEGPDAEVFALSLSFLVPGSFSAGAGFRYRLHGENTLSSEYGHTAEKAAMETPSGDNPERTITTSLFGEFSPLPSLSLGSELSFVDTLNAGHTAGKHLFDVQFVLYASFSTAHGTP